MVKDKKIVGKKSDDSKLYAFLGVFLPIIGYIILKLAKKEDAYSMYYAKQGLVLGIVSICLSVVFWILGSFIFFFSFFWVFGTLINLAIFVLWIFGIIYSLSGEKKEIPLIGQLTKTFFK